MSLGYKNIISRIIQATYTQEIRDKQDRKPLEMNKRGLLIEFDLGRSVCVDVLKRDMYLYEEDSYYPKLEVLLYAEYAAVGVYTRTYDVHNIRKLKPEGFEKCWSHHDTCWRTDGVDRVVCFMEDIVDGMWSISGDTWYIIAELDNDMLHNLLELRQARLRR